MFGGHNLKKRKTGNDRGTVIVKQPAAYQEGVLRAFDEEKWPPRIDDPLVPRPGQDSKRWLHSTISKLNRSQEACLIHFGGGSYGQSITWCILAWE
jgi:hypothetical protein